MTKPRVSQARLDRLWMHLLKIEELTGMKLIKRPRYLDSDACPMENFAPVWDNKGNRFSCVYHWGRIEYLSYMYYYVFEQSDADWWNSLSESTHKSITNWIIEKLKEREAQNR